MPPQPCLSQVVLEQHKVPGSSGIAFATALLISFNSLFLAKTKLSPEHRHVSVFVCENLFSAQRRFGFAASCFRHREKPNDMTTFLSAQCFIVYQILASPFSQHALVTLMLQTTSKAKRVQLSIPAPFPPWDWSAHQDATGNFGCCGLKGRKLS